MLLTRWTWANVSVLEGSSGYVKLWQENRSFSLDLEYCKVMEESKGIFETTKGFINFKCKRDHLSQPKTIPLKKAGSLYQNDFKNANKKQALRDRSNYVGKERNQPIKTESHDVMKLSSVYRSSFEGADSPKPVRMGESPSFFLKNQNFEPPMSVYSRMSSFNQKCENLSYIKAKPRCDNLGVPKYNRMNSNSVYRVEFNVKLPSIHGREHPEVPLSAGLAKKMIH